MGKRFALEHGYLKDSPVTARRLPADQVSLPFPEEISETAKIVDSSPKNIRSAVIAKSIRH